MVFYFSATGNCKYVAQRISEELSDTMVFITDCLKSETFDFRIAEGERIGFVTPVYHWGLPTVVVDFMNKMSLSVSGNPYTYHVLTYYTNTGQGHKMMDKILKSKGISLNGKFIVRMPDTWTPIFDLSDKNKVLKILEVSKAQTSAVIQQIKDNVKGDYNNRKIPFSEIYYKHYRNGGKTEKFTVDPGCIVCGICEKNCPVSAIQIQNGKPVWVKNRCSQCLACLHRCPKFSIQFGNHTKKHGQYINPNVKL